MNDRILHSCIDYDSMYVDSKTPTKGNFLCPCCGNIIVRREVKVSRNTEVAQLNILSDPYCVDCGREYTIKINQDLSYEITQN